MVRVDNENILSIHDLTRRSTFITAFLYPPFIFQFTTSRGGRPPPGAGHNHTKDLSIHDLTRRSTSASERIYFATSLSIHDLTRRSTESAGSGSDRADLSIHDLTRRSTLPQMMILKAIRSFNSRPHEEVDSKYLQYFVNNWLNYWLLHLKRNFFLPLHAQIFYHHFYYLLNYWCESLSISCPLHIRTRKSTFLLHQN